MVQVYLPFVWATWDRMPILTDAVREAVYAAIVAKARAFGCESIVIGGIENHVHVLVRAAPQLNIPDMVPNMKGASSHLVTHVLNPDGFFKWQGGYAVISVSPRGMDWVAEYIQNPKAHHAGGTTQDFLEETFGGEG